MRPKASQDFLQIAALFAESVTVQEDRFDWRVNSISCKGPRSIFAALNICIPEIVRKVSDAAVHSAPKGAVSEIEFNKHLIRSGFESFRYRHRIKGFNDKWSKGLLIWKHIRWLDPRVTEELSLLHFRLDYLESKFHGVFSIKPRRRMDLISFLLTNSQELVRSPARPSDETHVFDGVMRQVPGAFSEPLNAFTSSPLLQNLSRDPSESSQLACWDLQLPVRGGGNGDGEAPPSWVMDHAQPIPHITLVTYRR